MHTPDFPVMLSHMTGQAAADAFVAAWRDRTGDAVAVNRRMRLFRLGELIWSARGPAGTARAAAGTDRDLGFSLGRRLTAYPVLNPRP
jgi:hypothetical protein